MNTALLVALLVCAPWRSGLRVTWFFVAAIAIFSLEMQLVTVLRLRGLPVVTIVNGTGLVCCLLFQENRKRGGAFCRSLSRKIASDWGAWGGLSGCSNIVVAALIAVAFTIICVRSFFFQPDSVDPYHLMKVYHIERNGNIAYIPALDYKVNALGYLYELLLVDLRQIPVVGKAVFRSANPILFLSFLLILLRAFREGAGRRQDLFLWTAPLFVSPFLTQFIVYKNDYFVFLLTLVALQVVHPTREDRQPEPFFFSGLAGGLALSTKFVSFPLVAVTLIFLPKSPRKFLWTSRGFWVLGFFLGALTGGFFFNISQNLAHYGSVMGPLENTGNMPVSLGQIGIDCFRFLLSLVDLGLVTPFRWPGRMQMGGNLGLVFAVLAGTYVALLAYRKAPLRPGLITLLFFVLFSAAYPDSDVAHRMILAPAFLLMTETVKAFVSLNQTNRRVQIGRGMILGATLFSIAGAASGFPHSSPARRLAALLPPELLNAGAFRQTSIPEPISWSVPASDFREERLRLRLINELATKKKHVANTIQENYLALQGVAYQQIAVTGKQQGREFPIRWHDEDLGKFDFVIIGPNHNPPNPKLLMRLNASLPPDERLTSVSGPQVPLRGVSCP